VLKWDKPWFFSLSRRILKTRKSEALTISVKEKKEDGIKKRNTSITNQSKENPRHSTITYPKEKIDNSPQTEQAHLISATQ